MHLVLAIIAYYGIGQDIGIGFWVIIASYGIGPDTGFLSSLVFGLNWFLAIIAF
ncbi:MAG: hypothetical protein ABIN01_23520 [Ferruginibacter sp.]